jgi:hypothetical protein
MAWLGCLQEIKRQRGSRKNPAAAASRPSSPQAPAHPIELWDRGWMADGVQLGCRLPGGATCAVASAYTYTLVVPRMAAVRGSAV